MKTKIAFNDIPNAIGRDEMKEVVGGGYAITTDNSIDHGFSADLKPFYWIFDLSGGGKGGSSSWHATANGMSTSNASDISRFFEYLTGQSNGQNISNFNPSMSQINSFISQEMQFKAGGTITLPNGTVWGGELNNVNVYYNTDPRSPNYNPYGQWNASTVAGVLQNMGDSVNGVGIVLTGSVAGAPVGVPMMVVGGVVSDTGALIELGVDIYGNTWESFDGEKWIIKGSLKAASHLVGNWDLLPENVKAYYEAWSMASDKWIDFMRELHTRN